MNAKDFAKVYEELRAAEPSVANIVTLPTGITMQPVDPFAGLQVVATVFYGGRVWEVMGKELLDVASAVDLKNMVEHDKAPLFGDKFRVREVAASRAETKAERSQADLVRTGAAFNQGIIDLPTYNRMMYGEGMPGHPEIGRSPLKQSAHVETIVTTTDTVKKTNLRIVPQGMGIVVPEHGCIVGTIEQATAVSSWLRNENVKAPEKTADDDLPAPVTVRSEG